MQAYADRPSITGPITDYAPLGTNPPKSEEEVLAKKVLDKAPTNCKPIDVALYFLGVANGQQGEELRSYTTAWPVRWNPVIVKFFAATNTTPSGDTTAWCAAFVNFRLQQAAKGRAPIAGASDPTFSAASSSFRGWSSKVDLDKGETPEPGDIVVFRNKTSPGHGHVGFYVAQDANTILVLGGNQFEGTPVRHAINRKRLVKNGSVLQFHSFRTDPQLHA